MMGEKPPYPHDSREKCSPPTPLSAKAPCILCVTKSDCHFNALLFSISAPCFVCLPQSPKTKQKDGFASTCCGSLGDVRCMPMAESYRIYVYIGICHFLFATKKENHPRCAALGSRLVWVCFVSVCVCGGECVCILLPALLPAPCCSPRLLSRLLHESDSANRGK